MNAPTIKEFISIVTQSLIKNKVFEKLGYFEIAYFPLRSGAVISSLTRLIKYFIFDLSFKMLST